MSYGVEDFIDDVEEGVGNIGGQIGRAIANPIDTINSLLKNEEVLGLLGGLGVGQAYGDLGALGDEGLRLGTELGQDLLNQTEFRPYGITTASGSQFNVGMGPDGQMTATQSISPEEQAMRERLLGGAAGFYDQAMVDPAQRTQDIYGRMLTAMQPGMERQRLANEERMAAQGRLGISSNMYGGMAPEDFQLNLAQQEAMNNAYLGAMQQARGEQAQQAALGQQYFGASYLPQTQLTQALQPGLTAAGQRQQAQLYGAGLFGDARASGIDALLGAGLGRGNIVGSASTGLLSGLFGR